MKKIAFDALVESIKQAGKIRRGEMKPSRTFKFDAVSAKKVRTKLHLSQDEFARMFRVSVGTLKGWEQGRRVPEGPAAALLKVIEKNPQAVLEALDAS